MDGMKDWFFKKINEFILFLALLFSFLGGGSGKSLAEGMYEDALLASRDEAISAAEAGQGSWKDVADIEQEMKNNDML